MRRHALACALIALGGAATPAAAQATNLADRIGHPLAVENPNGGNGEYVTLLATPAPESFQALQVVYSTLKIPVTSLDPDHGVIGTTNWTVPHWLAGHQLSRYFDCGSGRGQSADEMSVKLTIHSTISNDTAATRSLLTTTLDVTAASQIEMAHPMPCQTTGELETRISDEVVKLLKK